MLALACACGNSLKVVSMGWMHIEKQEFLDWCKLVSTLEQLDISGISGSIDDESIEHLCRCCPSLQVLDASDCYDITDAAVKFITDHLEYIWRVSMSRCHHVTVTAMQQLARKANLTHLDLFGCYQSVYPQITVCYISRLSVTN